MASLARTARLYLGSELLGITPIQTQRWAKINSVRLNVYFKYYLNSFFCRCRRELIKGQNQFIVISVQERILS